MKDIIEREITIQASLDKVWSVLTTADYITQWYSFGGTELDLKPGGNIAFRWDEHGKYNGTIVAVEPKHKFSFRFSPFEADTQPTEGHATVVTFTLTGDGDTTVVHFTESGYASLALNDDEKMENYQTSEGAWDDSLSLLKQVAEK